jgi:hypothetical protein
MKTKSFTIIFVLCLILIFSCKKAGSPNDNLSDSPLVGTNWKLQTIGFSYSGTLVDQDKWKNYLLNSGVVTLAGNLNLLLSDTSFIFSAELNNSYSEYFQETLVGLCSGSFQFKGDLLTLKARDSFGVFELGRAEQEAYINYEITGDELSMTLILPTYQKTVSSPGYLKVGEEFYSCIFKKQS